MAEDLRTPLQKAIDESTRYIDMTYRYADDPDRMIYDHPKLWNPFDRWESFYKVIPPTLRWTDYDGHSNSLKCAEFYKKLLKRVEIMPCQFHAILYHIFHRNGVKGRVYDFINDNVSRISDCREHYMRGRMKRQRISDEEINEIIRQQLLAIAGIDRKKALLDWEFRKEVADRLIQYPQLWSWDRMYEFYLRNTRHSVTDLDDAEYYLNNEGRGDKYRFNIEAIRNKYADKSPWKSISKITDKTTAARQSVIKSQQNKDSFNVKAQRKLMKHYVAPRFTFVIDYFFAGRYRYLLAINVNTRKAFYAIPREIYRVGHNWNIVAKRGEWNVSATSAVESMEHLMQNTEVRALIMDNESAFNSDSFRRFLQRNNITFTYVPKYNVGKIIETQTASRSTHTTSLIDRLCRTLRQMNNNLGNRNEINPPLMNYLIDEYNNSVHRTLSKILGRQVTPNEVDGNVQLETELVKRIRLENFRMEGSLFYPVGDKVRVYNDADNMDKVKPKLLPGTWQFVERVNGLYKLKQGNNTIVVPRWYCLNA